MGRAPKVKEVPVEEAITEFELGPEDPPGLLKLLAGTSGDLHAVESRLGEIANIIGSAINQAHGDTRIALMALESLL